MGNFGQEVQANSPTLNSAWTNIVIAGATRIMPCLEGTIHLPLPQASAHSLAPLGLGYVGTMKRSALSGFWVVLHDFDLERR